MRPVATLEIRLHLGDQLGANRRVLRARAQRVASPGLGPPRQQRRTETRARRGVWILIRRDRLARFPRVFDDPDDAVALTPDVSAERFDVRDVDRDFRLASDAERFVHGADQANGVGALVAEM